MKNINNDKHTSLMGKFNFEIIRSMNRLFKIVPFFLLFMIVSCDENQGAVYRGNVDEFTFLTTNGNVYRLEVIVDSTGTLIVPLNASTLSSVDRTYSIDFVPAEEGASVADPATYDLPTSVTIPANQWRGDIVIKGQDLGLVETNAKPFTFRITGLNDKEFMDENTVTIEVVEVCPLGENTTFTGNYVVTSVVNGPFFNQTGPEFAEGSVVTLTGTGFTRAFSANYYPAFFNVPVNFSFNLQCDEVWVNDIDTGALCTAGPSTVKILRGNVPGSYNTDDDSEIIVTFSADYGDCTDAPPQQITFRLTKQ